MKRKPSYFLGYQEEWLKDTSRMKVAEKSRRIGWTYVQAYEDVVDAAKQGGMDVYFTSADLSAAREYVRYVEQWATLLNRAATYLGEVVLDEEDDVKALVVEFANGKRIHALSSNPKGFRSKGGKVVIDEYAFHENADELWKAAAPSILWGYPIRVFSSHNGKDTRFYRLCEEAQQAGSKWKHHKVTIEDAIRDGLVARIKRLARDATPEEIEEFRAECRAIAGDDETYEQEFMCNPLDGKTQYISHELITACEHPDAPAPIVIRGDTPEVNDVPHYAYKPIVPVTLAELLASDRALYLGVDIGRKRDLTVIWLDELIGDVSWTRFIWELHRVKFRHQMAHLRVLLPHVRRACIDSTGMGAQLAEDARDDFGSKVEEVVFNNKVKEDLAITTLRGFEDLALRNPKSDVVRADFRKIKKSRTASGAARFEGERDKDGHADRFWARALARHAAVARKPPSGIITLFS